MRAYLDFGGPPKGMESFFQQLDSIKRRTHAHDERAKAVEPTRTNPTPTTLDRSEIAPSGAPPSSSDNSAVIPNEPIGPSKLQAATFAALGARKSLVKTGFTDAMNADRAAYAAQVNRYATPALQRLSPEFAAAAEADRVAHASLIGRYVSPVLERTDGILGGVGGLAAGAAEFLGPLALAEGVTRAVDSIPTDRQWYTPVQPDEVQFSVDGAPPKAAKVFNHATVIPTATFQQDEKGLQDAYGNSQGTAYDEKTHTEYIKGSTTKRDFWDDITKIPLGDTARSQRYSQALGAYAGLVKGGKQVDRLVGHSLGGSVALELAKNLERVGKHVETRTFGAPVLDVVPRNMQNPKPDRYRHPGDIVSVLDRGAEMGGLKLYPHSYGGF